LAALVVAYKNEEFKAYFQRKVSEGKSKMSVLNAIKNKLVLRMVAVIRNDKPYERQVKKIKAVSHSSNANCLKQI